MSELGNYATVTNIHLNNSLHKNPTLPASAFLQGVSIILTGLSNCNKNSNLRLLEENNNSNDLDKMSLTDVEKSRAVVNLPKVSIVPNWNNGVNEFKLTDIHFEYKIGNKNQYIQYEWDDLENVKGEPIYQSGSVTLLSKLETIYPTNCTNRKVTYNVGTKNQIISDTTSSTDKNNWCVKPDEGGLKFYSQTKSLEDSFSIITVSFTSDVEVGVNDIFLT